MGIRMHHRNTWSAPLQLIDSWLPPARPAPTMQHTLSMVAQRFVQAGWLQRRASNDEPCRPPAESRLRMSAAPARALRVARRQSAGNPADSRVRLSGRMIEVCAELDRLAALEAH